MAERLCECIVSGVLCVAACLLHVCLVSLIVCFLFQPAARIATQVETTNFIVDENGQHERNGRQPPHEPVPRKKKQSSRWVNNYVIQAENGARGEMGVTHLRGYMRRPLSMPGQYDRKAASAVSKTRPKFSAQLRMPWCTIELRRVLHTIRSAHWTTTIDTKKAV